MLRELCRVSPHHAAVLPDDAFGAPDETVGPALTTRNGERSGGAYSLYRRDFAGEPNAHEALIADTAEHIRVRMAHDVG